jgi:hypothetical protein
MKNILQKEIMKGLKKLGISQQYNVLGLINNIGSGMMLPNRMMSLSPVMKDQAMKDIKNALMAGPERMDF